MFAFSARWTLSLALGLTCISCERCGESSAQPFEDARTSNPRDDIPRLEGAETDFPAPDSPNEDLPGEDSPAQDIPGTEVVAADTPGDELAGTDASQADVPVGVNDWGAWEWETRGIGGGGTFLAAAINPHDPNDMVISTDMAMAFRTFDHATSWRGYHFENLRGGDRAALHWTANPQIVFSIDGRGWDGARPVRSTDGGRSWQPLSNDPTGGQAWWIAVDPSSTERVLLAGWATLYSSTDGGASFQPVHSASQDTGLYLAGVV